jgi:hypothetical protein
MATTFLNLSGEISWANNLLELDTKYPSNDGAGKYRLNLKIDDNSMGAYLASGLRLRPKDGVYSFRRPEFKVIKDEKVAFGPPKVIGVPEGKLIGNGSKVTAKIVVYDTQMGKGHRLESVTIDELIEYVPELPADVEPPVA